MKNIAILLHSLTAEYSIDILTGINDYFKDKDVKLFIAQIKQPTFSNAYYDYQYWSGASYLFSEEIDGIIILSGSFSPYFPKGLLEEQLKEFPEKPIISIGYDIKMNKSYTVVVECEDAFNKIIKHFKEHGCTKFAYMTANNNLSPESESRFEAYKKALAKNDIEFNPDFIFRGNFTAKSAEDEFKRLFKKKTDIKFDALLCANDNMASGCIHIMQKLGVKIPKDVKVAGFDNTIHSTILKPSLTTISQKISEQGYKAANLIYKVISGKSISKKNTITATALYRQSCGCIKKSDLPEIYKDQNGKIIHTEHTDLEKTGIFKSSKRYLSFLKKIESVQTIFDLSDASSTLEKLFYSMPYALQTADLKSIIVCFFDEPSIVKRDEKFILPDNANVSMIVDPANGLNVFEPGKNFNPRVNILPPDYNFNNAGSYILQPIFSAEKIYGYITCCIKSESYAIYSLILKIIVNSLAQSYEYTLQKQENDLLSKENEYLQQSNTNLDEQSKTDELTHVLNRRGFMELGKKTIDLAVEMESNGLLIFADMDGLKKINDTYGHKVGDAAIKSIASILTQSLRANDVVARIGGDEFVCLAIRMTQDHLGKVREEIDALCREAEEKHNYPFKLSVSIGAVTFDKNNSDIKELLSAADELLYVEKKRKHAARE